ncbi:3649_t:CDS:1, partial [Entrophospora sp. SA101]
PFASITIGFLDCFTSKKGYMDITCSWLSENFEPVKILSRWEKIAKILLDDNEWHLIKQLVEILKQFDTITSTLSGRGFL